MIRAKVLKPLIYKGQIYNVGDIVFIDDEILITLEQRGIVARIFGEGNGTEIISDGLPSLEEEQKSKGKKK